MQTSENKNFNEKLVKLEKKFESIDKKYEAILEKL